jgi:5-methylthioribose kinase
MIRRMHGLAHDIDIDEIDDIERRRDVQILVLELAEELMMNRQSFSEIQAVTRLVSSRIR